MLSESYDFVVIGGGSGGVRAARIAANLGAKVALIEGFRLGGTCVIRGCVPKKLYMQASQFSDYFSDAQGFGWQFNDHSMPVFNWSHLVAAKDHEIDRLSAIYKQLLHQAGVTVIQGMASFTDAQTICVQSFTTDPENPSTQQYVQGKHILIATGGVPHLPNFPGSAWTITSNEVFDLPQFPRRILVVGGGYIAIEFAGIFHGLGSKVTVSYRGTEILRGFDNDVCSHVHDAMEKKGIDIRTKNQVKRIDRLTGLDNTTPPLQVTFDDNVIEDFDVVLMATGRLPNTKNLNLSAAGVAAESDGGIIVNTQFQTSVKSIYAVGDVNRGVALTPVAIRQGAWLARHLFGASLKPYALDSIPSAVFCQPGIGTVGLSEHDALTKYGKVDVYCSRFKPMRNTLTNNEEKILIKLIVDHKSDRILGVHMVGGDAAEIIQGLAVAVNMGARKSDFDATLGIHPTTAEEFMTMRQKVTKSA